jgi:Spy/CpxP family protein refolding chaperone
MKSALVVLLTATGLVGLGAAGGLAQHKGSGSGSGSGMAAHHQQYAGQQSREVSSFSDEEAELHRQGRGLGYARPAELNGYPGPMHVLELAGELGLTDSQRREVKAVFDRMLARAQTAGAAYIEAEKRLDRVFRSGTADAATVARAVQEADSRRAEKRVAHLEAHIETHAILSQEQRHAYARLRGYTASRSK